MGVGTDVALKAQALGKSYEMSTGPLWVLRNISLQVKVGQYLAVVGPSGCGKTTLLSILAGLDVPSEGDVRVFGTGLKGMTESRLARLRLGTIGFVFQASYLLPTMTAFQNVCVPLLLLGTVDTSERARSLLEAVGLGNRLHHYPSQLSAGEQQRVAIARALSTGPRIIFADEPTGNLDQVSSSAIVELLMAAKNRGAALVLATHDRNLADAADNVLSLKKGLQS